MNYKLSNYSSDKLILENNKNIKISHTYISNELTINNASVVVLENCYVDTLNVSNVDVIIIRGCHIPRCVTNKIRLFKWSGNNIISVCSIIKCDIFRININPVTTKLHIDAPKIIFCDNNEKMVIRTDRSLRIKIRKKYGIVITIGNILGLSSTIKRYYIYLLHTCVSGKVSAHNIKFQGCMGEIVIGHINLLIASYDSIRFKENENSFIKYCGVYYVSNYVDLAKVTPVNVQNYMYDEMVIGDETLIISFYGSKIYFTTDGIDDVVFDNENKIKKEKYNDLCTTTQIAYDSVQNVMSRCC